MTTTDRRTSGTTRRFAVAPLSTFFKVTTGAQLLVVAGLLAVIFLFAAGSGVAGCYLLLSAPVAQDKVGETVGCFVFAIVVPVGTLLLAGIQRAIFRSVIARDYEISSQGITIRWASGGRKVLPLADIESVEQVHHDQVVQRFGSGMVSGPRWMYGHNGARWGRRGRCEMHATRTDRMVLVTLRKGHPWVITPSPQEEFVALLERLLAESGPP